MLNIPKNETISFGFSRDDRYTINPSSGVQNPLYTRRTAKPYRAAVCEHYNIKDPLYRVVECWVFDISTHTSQTTWLTYSMEAIGSDQLNAYQEGLASFIKQGTAMTTAEVIASLVIGGIFRNSASNSAMVEFVNESGPRTTSDTLTQPP
ncbi:14095_t:CDS:2 [Acaulospora colombiana]|uniref:14095_t:CDS:1 n=1 Tax=Acaulospora colombiana TaxID=27376 RepID=A0ACA9PRE7_9GLOM|nr:14095_t:CDS:2 [Acaulospora colombiana]